MTRKTPVFPAGGPKPGGPYQPRPARTTVQSVLAPGVGVEVDVIALRPEEE